MSDSFIDVKKDLRQGLGGRDMVNLWEEFGVRKHKPKPRPKIVYYKTMMGGRNKAPFGIIRISREIAEELKWENGKEYVVELNRAGGRQFVIRPNGINGFPVKIMKGGYAQFRIRDIYGDYFRNETVEAEDYRIVKDVLEFTLAKSMIETWDAESKPEQIKKSDKPYKPQTVILDGEMSALGESE